MVSDKCCIRVIKQSWALNAIGHTIYNYMKSIPPLRKCFAVNSIYASGDMLKNLVEHSDADIFHVHNQPDWMVEVVKKSAGGRPVIFDIHDPHFLMVADKQPNAEEMSAMYYADGFVHVSDGCKKESDAVHTKTNTKPNRVIYAYPILPSMCPDEDIVPDPSFNSIIYEGGISDKGAPQDKENGIKHFNLRYFVNVFNALRLENYNITIFPNSQLSPVSPYNTSGFAVTGPQGYDSMMVSLRPHGLGFVGAEFPSPLIMNAIPNKLFEYMSQGVVPLIYNCEEAAKFVRKHDCGIVLDSLFDIRGQIESQDPTSKRENVLKIRKEFTMESQTSDILSLYEEVLNNN